MFSLFVLLFLCDFCVQDPRLRDERCVDPLQQVQDDDEKEENLAEDLSATGVPSGAVQMFSICDCTPDDEVRDGDLDYYTDHIYFPIKALDDKTAAERAGSQHAPTQGKGCERTALPAPYPRKPSGPAARQTGSQGRPDQVQVQEEQGHDNVISYKNCAQCNRAVGLGLDALYECPFCLQWFCELCCRFGCHVCHPVPAESTPSRIYLHQQAPFKS